MKVSLEKLARQIEIRQNDLEAELKVEHPTQNEIAGCALQTARYHRRVSVQD